MKEIDTMGLLLERFGLPIFTILAIIGLGLYLFQDNVHKHFSSSKNNERKGKYNLLQLYKTNNYYFPYGGIKHVMLYGIVSYIENLPDGKIVLTFAFENNKVLTLNDTTKTKEPSVNMKQKVLLDGFIYKNEFLEFNISLISKQDKMKMFYHYSIVDSNVEMKFE